MKKLLIIQYEADDELSVLHVADPEETLPNGNKKVLKTFVGEWADEIYTQLTEDEGMYMKLPEDKDE